jgi:hypothetical protein
MDTVLWLSEWKKVKTRGVATVAMTSVDNEYSPYFAAKNVSDLINLQVHMPFNPGIH